MHVVSLSHEPKCGFPDFHRHPRAFHQEASWSGEWPCEGPGATVTSDRKLGGLQPQKRSSHCAGGGSLTPVPWLRATFLSLPGQRLHVSLCYPSMSFSSAYNPLF